MVASELPKRFKTCPIGFETELLDEQAVQQGITTTLDETRTWRPNKEAWHKKGIAAQVEIDIALLKVHLHKLQEYSKRKAFVSRCMREFVTDPRSTRAALVVLGIDDSDDEVKIQSCGQSEVQVQAHLSTLYRRIIDKEAELVIKDGDRQSKKDREQQ